MTSLYERVLQFVKTINRSNQRYKEIQEWVGEFFLKTQRLKISHVEPHKNGWIFTVFHKHCLKYTKPARLQTPDSNMPNLKNLILQIVLQIMTRQILKNLIQKNNLVSRSWLFKNDDLFDVGRFKKVGRLASNSRKWHITPPRK